MQEVLSKLLTLEAMTKEAHWNMNGRGFISVHRYLDELYASCEEYIDEVAEHMVTCHSFLPGTELIKEHRIPVWELEQFNHLTKKDLSVTEAVTSILRLIRRVLSMLSYWATKLTESARPDHAGADIMIRALQDFQNHYWFLSNEVKTVTVDM